LILARACFWFVGSLEKVMTQIDACANNLTGAAGPRDLSGRKQE
jgi:hypothetical protein